MTFTDFRQNYDEYHVLSLGKSKIYQWIDQWVRRFIVKYIYLMNDKFYQQSC
jgi:hypothetical protein